MHDAKIISTAITKKMVRQSAFGHSYKGKYMVLNMSTKTIECDGKQISIYNQLLFQRLLVTAGKDQVELESGLCFELNSKLASLFNTEGKSATKDTTHLKHAKGKKGRLVKMP